MSVGDKISSRIKIFDIIKLFAIFLVIWGHVILHLQNYQFAKWDNPLYRFICSFHMPLFMMISGFFSSKIKTGINDYVINKIRHLILPSLTFGTIFVLSWHYICGGEILKPYIMCYWFLKSAFICSLLYYIANKSHNKTLGYSITIFFSMFCYLYQVNMMYIPFIVGTALFHKKDFLIKRSLLICLFTGIIFFIMYFNWNSEMASMPLLRLHQYINPASWNLLEYPFLCYIYQIIMGLTGSIFVISLFIKLSQVLPESKIGNILAYWGTLTLGIYVWQAVLLEHIMMKTINLANIDYITFNYIISPIISVVVLIVCVALTKALKANKWSAFLFLGSKSTK